MFKPFSDICRNREVVDESPVDEVLVATDPLSMTPSAPGRVWRECVLYGVSPTFISGELYDDDDFDGVDPSSDPRSNYTDMIEDRVSTALDAMRVPVDPPAASPEATVPAGSTESE